MDFIDFDKATIPFDSEFGGSVFDSLDHVPEYQESEENWWLEDK